MSQSMAVASLVAALDIALSTENVLKDEPSSYGDYACHACGSTTSDPTGGCVSPNCWVETAEMLRRKLSAPDRSKAHGE